MAVMSLPADVPEVPEEPAAPVAKARKHLKVIGQRVRAQTIPSGHLNWEERHAAETVTYPEGAERPKTRGECADGPRPCPWASCHYHLFLDVNPDNGSIKLNFPHLEIDEMKETCALDVADRGGVILEEVGRIYNITRERVRQLQVRGLRMMEREGGEGLGLPAPRRDH